VEFTVFWGAKGVARGTGHFFTVPQTPRGVGTQIPGVFGQKNSKYPKNLPEGSTTGQP